ncbi:pyridoxamine 5'-phosphate oxidase family protein [Hydrogenophaga sp.]|uniref:pyridoxamine 5'-phosphate oxidase family protein n=1 Tax=Hydrogenophaga sp. TaxID=1904254 RepID=UPI002FC9C3BE
MNIETQTTPELKHIAELIKGIATSMLTTIEADGSLASRPMYALEMDASGAIWFFTDTRSAKVERLRVANLAFTDLDDSTYVSLSGHGEIVIDRGHIERLWSSFARPWVPDGPDSPNLALLKFVPHAADYWDAPNSKMVRAVSDLVSIVAGKPIGMGEHGSHEGLSRGALPVGSRA